MPNQNEQENKKADPPTEFEARLISRRSWSLRGSGLLIAIGLAMLGFALWRFFSEERGIGLVVPGCSLIAAGVASGVATLGLVSWAEQRQRDRESAEYRHREHVYEQLGVYMVNRFQGFDVDRRTEAELRVGATLWGSESLVRHLGRYQTMISRLLGGASSGSVSLTTEEQVEMKGIIADILQSMRRDLQPFTGQEPVSNAALLDSLFNRDKPVVEPAPPSQ